MTETCGTCKFGKVYYDPLGEGIHVANARLCQRHAPRPGQAGGFHWPEVGVDQWCGEYVTRTKLNAIELEDRENWDIDKRYAAMYILSLNWTMSDLAVYRTITDAPQSVVLAWADAGRQIRPSSA